MDTTQWLVWGLSAVVSALAGAGLVHVWAARRYADLLQRLDKVDKARQLNGQHAAQARRQIEQLQKDLAAQHKARADDRAARKREVSESLDDNFEKTLRFERPVVPAVPEAPPPLPAHGFADTLPMT
jgi:hypothetical protein